MSIDIPFGAVSGGITAQSVEVDVSFGKLYSGGTSLYLFVQNKIRRTSLSTTVFHSCVEWIVVGVDRSGGVSNSDTPSDNMFPLEQMTASYQEEPNIIWKAANPGQTPDEVMPGDNPNIIAPATTIDCLQIIGYNANFSIAVKGPEGILDSFNPTTFLDAVGENNVPDEVAWNRGYSIQKSRTDWQVFTKTGKGYGVGGSLYDNMIIITPGPESPRKTYYALNISVTARGDVTRGETMFEILDT